MFSSRDFMVSGLTFISLIHFDFIFTYVIRKWSSFNYLHVALQFPQHLFIEGTVFPSLYILGSFVID